jgi:hypothetical protein
MAGPDRNDPLFRRPTSRSADDQEQDQSAGGRSMRMVELPGGTRTSGKIRLHPAEQGARALLYYRAHGRDFQKEIGIFDPTERAEILAQAWNVARERGLLRH